MIHFVKGNLLESEAEALVNTVNCIGVMGKGIALQFKEAFPYNFQQYKDACAVDLVQVGRLFSVSDSNLIYGDKIIINFPTKMNWWEPSQYEYIVSGLLKLEKFLTGRKVKSVAIPPLGCGNGGLDWNVVKKMIIEVLGDIDCEVFVYENVK